MFSQIYGNYLVKYNIISQKDFNEVIAFQKTARVKLGLIAITEKLLTMEQADELNKLQAIMDKRFGDIAVEKGYLTEEQVGHLLSLQGNPYLSFAQAITEKGIMNLQEVEANLSNFQKDGNFTNEEMEALKNGDTDRIISMLVNIKKPLYNELIGLAIRNIIRFIDSDIYIENAYSVQDYTFDALASQSLQGQHSIFLAFSGKDNTLLSIASPYAKEEFEVVNDDAFDSICEFLNCINGLFASKLSHENVELDMLPPLFYTGQKLVANNQIYVVPVIISGTRVDLLISIDNELSIQ